MLFLEPAKPRFLRHVCSKNVILGHLGVSKMFQKNDETSMQKRCSKMMAKLMPKWSRPKWGPEIVKNASKNVEKSMQNRCSKMVSKMMPKWSQNGPKCGPGTVKNALKIARKIRSKNGGFLEAWDFPSFLPPYGGGWHFGTP